MFINNYIVIDEPQADGVATVPFHLWPKQADVLARLVVEKLVIILKARQLGISWLCCAYALWLCLFKPGRVVLTFSEREDKAQELIRRLRVMYMRLPDWMRARVPLITDNAQSLEWGNGSRASAAAATKGSGRSLTASLVLLDEFAFMQWGEDVYTAVKPTIDAGGQLFIVSTANGLGDKFNELWKAAVAGASRFVALFLSWRDRPSRDDAWREAVQADALDKIKDKQEYPATPDEALQSSGLRRFKREWFEIVDAVPADLSEARWWDTAGTLPKPGKDPDWTRGVKAGYSGGKTFITDVRSTRDTPHNVESLIKQTAQLDGIGVTQYMGQEPGDAGIKMIDDYRLLLVGYTFYGIRETGPKELYINPVSSQAEAGNIKLLRGAWNSAFLDEAEGYGMAGTHDDQLDALGKLCNKLWLSTEASMGTIETHEYTIGGSSPF